MAGTVTTTTTVGTSRAQSRVQRRDYAWTSDASAGTWSVTTEPINGIPQFHFKPGSGGTQPTNGYAVTALNDLGVDMLAGQASSLSNATATALSSSLPLKDGTTTTPCPGFVSGPLTISGSGCGNSKTGTVTVFWA